MRKLIAAVTLAIALGLTANAESLKYHDQVVVDNKTYSVTARSITIYCTEGLYTLKLQYKHTFIKKCGEALVKTNKGRNI